MATENEIRALSAEELRSLQADQSRQSREINEPRVHYPPDLNPEFIAPDVVDLRRLFYLVTAAYPQLAPQRDRDPEEAFRYLASPSSVLPIWAASISSRPSLRSRGGPTRRPGG
jgi:hypothetical protein